MNQATQPSTPTASTVVEEIDSHDSYKRARALADKLVGMADVLPDSVEIRLEYGTSVYGIRLHFGTGLNAGRGVLATAAAADVEVTREDVRRNGIADVTWIELSTRYKGVQLIARALVTPVDADTLLQPARDVEATQPIATIGTAVAGDPGQAVFKVTPLAAKTEPTAAAESAL